MDLLLSLSGEGGRTVIVVTHDAEIAGRAERVLRMHDGKLLPPLEAASTVVSLQSFGSS